MDAIHLLRLFLKAGAAVHKVNQKKQDRLRLEQDRLRLKAARIEDAAKKKRERRTLICPSCRVEFAAKDRCCITCGSKTTITVAQLREYDAAEADARRKLRWEREAVERAAQIKLAAEIKSQETAIKNQEEAQRANSMRRNAARVRYHEIIQQSFCRTCFDVRPPEANFCGICTRSCEKEPPLGVIYDLLHREYPDLVPTPDNIRHIAALRAPSQDEQPISTAQATKIVASWGIKTAGKGIRWLLR